MLSSPLLLLYLIILLSTLIFFDSSASKKKKKKQNSKVQPESEAFLQQILSCVVFSFFSDQFHPLQKNPMLYTKQMW